jgi:predicted DNA binding CopG/RHH family protein
MLKQLPVLTTDEEAEEWLENADLTEYDLSGFKPYKFNFVPKPESKPETMTMRLRPGLKKEFKETAAKSGIPYQKVIHQMMEAFVAQNR